MTHLSATLTFENKDTKEMTFILEPWAEEFVVPCRSTVSVHIDAQKIGNIQTELTPKYFVLWLWAGCRARVCVDGRDQTPKSLAIPAIG